MENCKGTQVLGLLLRNPLSTNIKLFSLLSGLGNPNFVLVSIPQGNITTASKSINPDLFDNPNLLQLTGLEVGVTSSVQRGRRQNLLEVFWVKFLG